MVATDLRRLVGLLRPFWLRLVVAALLMATASLLGLALPWVIRELVDEVLTRGDLGQLDGLALALLVLFVVQAGLAYVQALLLAGVGQRLVNDLRRQLQAQLSALPLGFFATRRTGELLSRVNNDVTLVREAITTVPISLPSQLITLVGGLTLMVLMSWSLTLLIVAVLPLVIGLSLVFGDRLRRLTAAMLDRLSESSVALEELLAGIRVVKSFTAEPLEHARYGQSLQRLLAAALAQARLQAAFGPVIALVSFSALSLLLWYGGRQVIAGDLTPGQLIAFLFYMLMVAGPIAELARAFGRLSEAIGASRHLFGLLDEPTEPMGGSVASPAPPVPGAVRFVGVTFGYAPDRPVLTDIELDVQPSEVIALVGPSGAGKTSLVNLLPRLYEPQRGRVEIDGRDTRDYDLTTLRQQIGLVPQETFLFGGSVRENIAYGRPAASEAEIEAAARAADAADFIAALPAGYDTIVGERGVRLSMGQRQRLAIARVLLKDPPILILDEATSSLDTQSERAVQAALDRLRQGRTTFIIAHRLSTIRHADRIVVLDGGRIIEQGSHDQLLAHGGLYHRLWSLQFADEALLPLGSAPG